MKLTTLLFTFLPLVLTQTCPSAPPGALDNFGQGIPPNPSHIPTGCSALEVLVARGTSEPNFQPNGKFGVIVGDPVISNLTLQIPDARGYPVQYPASSNILGVRTGATDVVNRITSQSRACPNQLFALVGYSQGASVMHSAGDRLSTALKRKVVAAIMFGDPANKRSGGGVAQWPADLRGKALNICAEGDPVCDSGSCFFWHLTYIREEYIQQAVSFIVGKFGTR